MSRIEISVSPRELSGLLWRTLFALWLGNLLAFALLHYGGIEDGWGVVTLLHFDREQNLPTLFSVLLLLGASLLALLHAQSQPHATPLRSGWFVVALVLSLMAIDEFASIHERIDAALRYYLGSDVLPYAAWPIPYVLGVVALGVILWRWFFCLARALALRLVLAGAVFVSGAVGIELIAGEYLAHIDPHHLGITHPTRDLFATLEESLEMAALIFLIQTLAAGVAADQADTDPATNKKDTRPANDRVSQPV